MGDEMAYKQSDSLEVSTKPVAKSDDIYNYLVYSWMSFLIFLSKHLYACRIISSTVVILIIYKLSVSIFSFLEKILRYHAAWSAPRSSKEPCAVSNCVAHN